MPPMDGSAKGASLYTTFSGLRGAEGRPARADPDRDLGFTWPGIVAEAGAKNVKGGIDIQPAFRHVDDRVPIVKAVPPEGAEQVERAADGHESIDHRETPPGGRPSGKSASMAMIVPKL